MLKNNGRWHSMLLLILSLSLLTGCDEDNSTNIDDIEPGTMTATVAGDPMDYSDGANAVALDDPAGWYTLTGSDMDGNFIVIAMPGIVDSYDFGGASDPNLVLQHEGVTYAAVTGSLNIATAGETSLAGSFNATLTDDQLNTVNLTDGLFHVEIAPIEP